MKHGVWFLFILTLCNFSSAKTRYLGVDNSTRSLETYSGGPVCPVNISGSINFVRNNKQVLTLITPRYSRWAENNVTIRPISAIKWAGAIVPIKNPQLFPLPVAQPAIPEHDYVVGPSFWVNSHPGLAGGFIVTSLQKAKIQREMVTFVALSFYSLEGFGTYLGEAAPDWIVNNVKEGEGVIKIKERIGWEKYRLVNRAVYSVDAE